MPATWIATWRGAAHVGGGSLAEGDQETQAGALTLMRDQKEKPSRLLWTGTISMKPGCAIGVEITCKNTFMANCVVRVGHLFPLIDLGRCLLYKHTMDCCMERQAPLLKSVLEEADQHHRQELLRMASADQINVISELVIKTIRGTVPRSRHMITLLKSNAQSLRAMAKPAHSVKRRRAIMMSQEGGNLWSDVINVACVRTRASVAP